MLLLKLFVNTPEFYMFSVISRSFLNVFRICRINFIVVFVNLQKRERVYINGIHCRVPASTAAVSRSI